jgi:hypothetical protein
MISSLPKDGYRLVKCSYSIAGFARFNQHAAAVIHGDA